MKLESQADDILLVTIILIINAFPTSFNIFSNRFPHLDTESKDMPCISYRAKIYSGSVKYKITTSGIKLNSKAQERLTLQKFKVLKSPIKTKFGSYNKAINDS